MWKNWHIFSNKSPHGNFYHLWSMLWHLKWNERDSVRLSISISKGEWVSGNPFKIHSEVEHMALVCANAMCVCTYTCVCVSITRLTHLVSINRQLCSHRSLPFLPKSYGWFLILPFISQTNTVFCHLSMSALFLLGIFNLLLSGFCKVSESLDISWKLCMFVCLHIVQERESEAFVQFPKRSKLIPTLKNTDVNTRKKKWWLGVQSLEVDWPRHLASL